MPTTKIIDITKIPAQTDESLFAEYLEKRDVQILAAVFRKYMTLIFGVCMKYLRDKSKAQSATLRVFEHLKALDSFNSPSLRSEIYALTIQECRDQLTKDAEQNLIKPQIIDRLTEKLDNNESTPAHVQKLLSDLEWICIDAFYNHKMSYLEISTSQKITIAAVKNHISNAKLILNSNPSGL